jgi:hypothetical protein
MYKTLFKAFLMLSLATVHVVQGYAQDQMTTVTLASPQAMPGNRTYVTSLLTNSAEISVYHLQHRLEFPQDKLTLVSTRLGIAANLANAVLTVELQEEAGSDEGMPEARSGDEALSEGERSEGEGMIAEGEAMVAEGEALIAAGKAILGVPAEASDGETAVLILTIKGDQAFPDGPIVEVTFDVAHIVPQTIVLPHQLEAFDEQGEKISDVVFSDAELHVSADQPDLPPAIFACLFYMH